MVSERQQTADRAPAVLLRETVAVFGDLVRRHEDELNRINVFPVADGDTGTNMSRTLVAVVAELDAASPALGPTCDAISRGSLFGARGNSGVILAQVLRAIAATVETAGAVDGVVVASALQAASIAADEAVFAPVEGTVLTVARASASAAAEVGTVDAAEVLKAARAAAAAALAATRFQLPALREAGVVDAAGAGFVLLLDAALHVVAGTPIARLAVLDDEPLRVVSGADDGRFEVVLRCDVADTFIGDLKERWAEIGDSIVAVGGSGSWLCHVHTADVDAVLDTVRAIGGSLHEVRVEDLAASTPVPDA